jgi:glycine cleavage system H protein
MTSHETPDDLRYTAEHEWVQQRPDGVFRVGITAYAQDALGDVVFVTLPEEGTPVAPGSACGEVESTKSVSDIFAPITGTVTARNDALDANPELVNSSPYGEGWMFEVRPDDPASIDSLLDAEGYRSLLG